MTFDKRHDRRLQRTIPAEASLKGKAVVVWRELHQEVGSFLFEEGRRTGAHGAALVLQSHKTGGVLHGGTVRDGKWSCVKIPRPDLQFLLGRCMLAMTYVMRAILSKSFL